MRAFAAIMVIVVLSAGAGEAAAAVRDGTEVHPIDAGPVLAGPGVAYIPARGRDRARVRLASRGEERDVARLVAAPRPADDTSFAERSISLALGGSDDALVVRLMTQFSHPDDSPTRYALETFAGPAAGPLSPVSPACESTPLQAFSDLGADGSSAATTGPGCGEASVLDVATGARRSLPAADRGDVQVAGDLVAWLEPMGPDPPPPGTDQAAGVVVVVLDGQGRELLRAPAPGALLPDTDLALATDGTVALLGRLSEDQLRDPAVATASPARPTLRRVPLPPRTAAVRGVRLAGGRLAILRSVAGRNQIADGEVTTLAPDGDTARTVLRGVDAYRGGFDFDGRHVAAMGRTCDGVVLVRRRVGAAGARVSSRRECRLRLASRPRLSRRGLRIALSCRGFERSCVPRTLVARLGGPTGRVVARARSSIHTRVFTLRVDRAARRLLRSHPRVFLTARITDRPDEASAPPRSATTALIFP